MKFSFKTQISINMSNNTNHKRPTILQSVIPILVLIGLISLNVITLGDDTLSGANQISLLIASSVATCIALYNKVTWQDILKGILHTLSAAMPAILILMMIGALAGTWMLSGIIPAMIHYGLYILRPDYFLPAAVIIAAIIAIATGSSWSTIATVGVALLGIGQTLGLNDAMIAGAIISGAYFGDKVSPLSDTTNLASATAGVNLFTHIRYMMFTTVPTILITIILFTIISLCIDVQPTDMSVDAVQQTITSTYHISPLLFIVPIIVIGMIARRVEPVPVLFLGAILGAILALITQSDVITQLSGQETLTFKNAYRIITQAMYGSLSINTGNPTVDTLFSTSGMAGMMNTIWLIITAMIFGGVMEAGQFLERITSALIQRVHSTGGLVTTTTGTCLLFNATASDQYIAIVVPGKMFYNAYRKNRLAPEVLSRTLEDTGTVTSVLFPWNTCGATQSSVLGVSTFTYLPYAFFCYLSPVMSILFAWLNIKIRRLPKAIDTNDTSLTTQSKGSANDTIA